MPTDRFTQNTGGPLTFQTIEENPPGCVSGSTNKRIAMQTDGGTKPAVDQRFIRGTTGALRSWLLTNVPTPSCLCKPFSCKACPGIMKPGQILDDPLTQISSAICRLGLAIHEWVAAELINFKPKHSTTTRTGHDSGDSWSLSTCRIQNPDIPRAGWGGASHGGGRAGRADQGWAGRVRVGGDGGGSVRQGDDRPSCPQGTEDNPHRRIFGSGIKVNPRETEWGNTMTG